MLPLFLAATDAAHAAGEASIVEKFGIEWHYVVWQIASFLILFAVLYKFGIKPTIATMEERNKKIAEGLKHAEDMQAKLAASQQEAAALARAADTLAKAQQAIELEHKKMLDQARGEIARLVVKTTEQVLAKKLSDSDRAAYNEAATKELSLT